MSLDVFTFLYNSFIQLLNLTPDRTPHSEFPQIPGLGVRLIADYS